MVFDRCGWMEVGGDECLQLGRSLLVLLPCRASCCTCCTIEQHAAIRCLPARRHVGHRVRRRGVEDHHAVGGLVVQVRHRLAVHHSLEPELHQQERER